MLEEFKEFLKVMGWVFIAGFVFVGIICLISIPLTYYECSSKGNMYDVETNYSLVSGCFVKYNEKYIPMNLYEKTMMDITNINILK